MKTSSKAVVRRSLWSAVLAWLSSGSPGVQRGMRGDVSVGFGFRASQGLARPFAAVGKSDQGRSAAAGLRYEALPGQSRIAGEFSIGHRRAAAIGTAGS